MPFDPSTLGLKGRQNQSSQESAVKQARLDLFLASSNILDITNTCEIRASYRSDHSTIELEMKINKGPLEIQ